MNKSEKRSVITDYHRPIERSTRADDSNRKLCTRKEKMIAKVSLALEKKEKRKASKSAYYPHTVDECSANE